MPNSNIRHHYLEIDMQKDGHYDKGKILDRTLE